MKRHNKVANKLKNAARVKLKLEGVDPSILSGFPGITWQIQQRHREKVRGCNGYDIIRAYLGLPLANKPIRVVEDSSKKQYTFANSDAFLQSYEWRKVRMEALKLHGATCQCCGATRHDAKIHVDHIKPRRKYPELALTLHNLQVLCEDCNHGKGNWDETDWRHDGDVVLAALDRFKLKSAS